MPGTAVAQTESATQLLQQTLKFEQALLQATLAQARLGQLGQARQWWRQISSADRVYYPEVLWQEAQMARRREQFAETTRYSWPYGP